MTGSVELYTTAGCEHSDAAREDLEWRGVEFVEYDVERDREAYARMLEITGGSRTVPPASAAAADVASASSVAK